jgi:large subunit ribosomal protein L28
VFINKVVQLVILIMLRSLANLAQIAVITGGKRSTTKSITDASVRVFSVLASGNQQLSSLFAYRDGRGTTTHHLLKTTTPTSTASTEEQRRYRSNRSRRGLYDGKDIRSGNSLSFSMKSTKRKFKPNVFTKRVYSEILDEMVRFHLTTSALRSIDKMGGLDNYLLTSPHITSGEGLQVKKRIVNRLKYHQRMVEAERGQQRANKEEEEQTGSSATI